MVGDSPGGQTPSYSLPFTLMEKSVFIYLDVSYFIILFLKLCFARYRVDIIIVDIILYCLIFFSVLHFNSFMVSEEICN
jgi:hypothetical protein